ncbi:MAG: hypothetical protein ABIF92_00935, partial [archaeon]
AEQLYFSAKQAFTGERYEEAAALIEETGINLDERRSEMTMVNAIKEASRTFFSKYWKHLIITAIILGALTVTGIKVTTRIRAKRKVRMLRIEERTLGNLMKKAQTARFKDKKLSEINYNIRMMKYREKLSDLKGKLPVYEAIARGEKPEKKGKKIQKSRKEHR